MKMNTKLRPGFRPGFLFGLYQKKLHLSMLQQLEFLSSHHLIVAIDGYAACGKSTLAKAMAKALKYRYIDSGAMYRAVTLYFIEHDIDIRKDLDVKSALDNISIDFAYVKNENHTFLNGKDVEHEIRMQRVNQLVSPVATISEVRRTLVDQQQLMGEKRDLVMDGRDIGTVVFPQADLKLFVTADINIRTERRQKELLSKGIDIGFSEIKNNLAERDQIDMTREDSPLTRAEDAILLDTSELTPEEQLKKAIDILYEKVKAGSLS